jgi:hypothetical protein
MNPEASVTVPQTATQAAPLFVQDAAPAFDGLLYTVFQQLRAASTEGIAVALTSANSGEGVTHSLTALVDSLGRDSSTKTLRIDSRHLRGTVCAPSKIRKLCQPIETNTFEFLGSTGTSTPAPVQNSWEGNWEYRRDCIHHLRAAFDYILIDCPALKAGRDVFSLAPLVDGIILVVEAGKTRVEQILHAERSIEFARGKLLGHILNKRTFTVPGWLYKRL